MTKMLIGLLATISLACGEVAIGYSDAIGGAAGEAAASGAAGSTSGGGGSSGGSSNSGGSPPIPPASGGSGGSGAAPCLIQHDTDLLVAYVSRSASYGAVPVSYFPDGYRPTPAPDDPSGTAWPLPGQPIRFTAHVKNRGDHAAHDVAFVWRLEGVAVHAGAIDRIEPGSAVDLGYDWPWQDQPTELTFELSARADCAALDHRPANDRRSQYTNALLLGARVWDDYADYYEAVHGPERGSMEEWIHRHVDRMNQIFADAASELAPNGVELRLAVDEIERVPSSTPDVGGTHYDGCGRDLCWGWVADERGDYRDWIDHLFDDEIEPGIDPGLLWLFGIQLGLIDLSAFELPISVSELTDVTVASAASSSSAGRRIDALFDGEAATAIATRTAGQVWFLLHFPEPRFVSKMRLRVADGGSYDWEVWSAGDEGAAVSGEGATLHASGHIDAGHGDFAELGFAFANARVWLIKVDRLDDDSVEVLEWELHDDNGAVQVLHPALGSPSLPDLGGGLVHRVSAGPDLMSTLTLELSPYHAWALNTTAHAGERGLPRRRGWYGDYLFHIPARNTLRVTSQGNPVNSAHVLIYQLQDGRLRNVPKFECQTDADGRCTIPEYTMPDWSRTHALDDNHVATPFGSQYSDLPAVTGANGLLVVRISPASRPPVYRVLDVPRFNTEYARGNREEAIYPVEIGPI